MIQLLKDRERQLVKERDNLLVALELKYMHYIHGLLQQKLTVANNIRAQYNKWINDNSELIYTTINNQFNVSTNALMCTIISSINSPQPSIADIPSTKKEEIAVELNDIDYDQPFIPHMSTEEVNQLSVNDNIDHRDVVQQSLPATIVNVDKQGTNFKIHYLGWDQEWDIWSDTKNELYKFAKYKSISHRPQHRLFALKVGDLVDINPIKHKGWKIGKILEIDEHSGQIKLSYNLVDDLAYFYYCWAHIDNRNELEALHTFTPRYDCVFCTLSFKTYAMLRSHVETVHAKSDPQRKYICKYCPEAFASIKGAGTHEKQHVHKGTFKCTLCPKLFECNTSFKLKTHLTWHYQRVHKIENNKKSVCGNKRKNLITNIPKAKKQKVISVRNKSKVSVSFEDSYYISVHCHICNKHFNDFDKYGSHLRRHYDNENDRGKTWKHCDLGCKINKNHPIKTAKYTGIYPSKMAFIQHIASHTSDRAFRCNVDQCQSKTSTKSAHEKHWQRHHSIQLQNEENGKSINAPLCYEHAKKMSVNQLRDEMKKRGLDVTGHKKTLLNRISSMQRTVMSTPKSFTSKSTTNGGENCSIVPSLYNMPIIPLINALQSNGYDKVYNVSSQMNNQQNISTEIQTQNDGNLLSVLPSLK